jgi:hypothetical protein
VVETDVEDGIEDREVGGSLSRKLRTCRVTTMGHLSLLISNHARDFTGQKKEKDSARARYIDDWTEPCWALHVKFREAEKAASDRPMLWRIHPFGFELGIEGEPKI